MSHRNQHKGIHTPEGFESLGEYISHLEYGYDDWGAPVLGYPSETPEGMRTREIVEGLRVFYGRENVITKPTSHELVEIMVRRDDNALYDLLKLN